MHAISEHHDSCTVVHVMQDELAANITQEQGKTLADAKGDVFRGLGKHMLHACTGSCRSIFVVLWLRKCAA